MIFKRSSIARTTLRRADSCCSQCCGCDVKKSFYNVPARLGKGQGAKEIGHNLARERLKLGHNLVRKRHKIFYS